MLLWVCSAGECISTAMIWMAAYKSVWGEAGRIDSVMALDLSRAQVDYQVVPLKSEIGIFTSKEKKGLIDNNVNSKEAYYIL